MECYLISGGTGPWESSGFISQTLRQYPSVKKLLVVASHHSQGQQYSERLSGYDPKLADYDVTFFDTYLYGRSYRLSDFDALYVTGGFYQILDVNLRYSHLFEDLSIPSQQPQVYIGASAGTMLMAQKLHTEMEADAVHLSRFFDTGLGIFPKVLFEVHYDEDSAELHRWRRNRLIETLNDPNNTDLEFAYAMNGDAVIHVSGDDFAKRRVLHGQCFVIQRDGSEVVEEGDEIEPAKQ